LNTQFKESFLKDLRAIKDRDLLAVLTKSFKPSRKLKHRKKFQPSRSSEVNAIISASELGDYRLGLKIEGQLVTLVRILNRKDIYRYFP